MSPPHSAWPWLSLAPHVTPRCSPAPTSGRGNAPLPPSLPGVTPAFGGSPGTCCAAAVQVHPGDHMPPRAHIPPQLHPTIWSMDDFRRVQQHDTPHHASPEDISLSSPGQEGHGPAVATLCRSIPLPASAAPQGWPIIGLFVLKPPLQTQPQQPQRPPARGSRRKGQPVSFPLFIETAMAEVTKNSASRCGEHSCPISPSSWWCRVSGPPQGAGDSLESWRSPGI